MKDTLLNIAAVVLPIVAFVVFVALKNSNKPVVTQQKCGCGKTQDADGYCDNSHEAS